MIRATRDLPPKAQRSLGRILVVDDHQALLHAMSRMLTTVGYEVSTAANGMRAVDLLAKGTFDVVLSDLDMPGMNGIQCLQAIRRRDSDVPVVLMTGNPDLKTAALAVEYGALQYLVKPVKMDELRQIVARAVGLNKIAQLKRAALFI